jgi:Fur family peroxide stress response transcriptional regulator
MQNKNKGDPLVTFTAKCKKHNLKVTPQRIAIFKELIKLKNHPSAEFLFQIVRRDFPNISFDTVNRTLLTFSKIGIVDVVEGHGRQRRFDPDMSSHHHFHCMECGRIIDFRNENYDSLKVPADIKKKFTVHSKRVVLKGTCDVCKKRA